MFPSLSKIQDDKVRVKRVYIRAISIIALVAFPMMLGLLVVADAFVLALFGPQWEAVIPVLQLLCLVGLAQSLGGTVGWIYTSQGRTDWMFRWGFITGILALLAFGIGIQGGVVGVAIAYTIYVYGLTYFNFTIPGKLIDMTFSDVLQGIGSILLCAIVMAMLTWGLGLMLPANWSHWAYLAVQVPFGMLVYATVVHLLGLEAYRDVHTLLTEQWRLRHGGWEPSIEL